MPRLRGSSVKWKCCGQTDTRNRWSTELIRAEIDKWGSTLWLKSARTFSSTSCNSLSFCSWLVLSISMILKIKQMTVCWLLNGCCMHLLINSVFQMHACRGHSVIGLCQCITVINQNQHQVGPCLKCHFAGALSSASLHDKPCHL